MSNILTQISDLFTRLIKWITGAEEKLAPVIDIAENVLNGLKSFDSSIVGQTVEGIIEEFVPASIGLINAFKLQLPVWIIELNWIRDENGKTLEQQWQDALNYLASITDPKTKAVQLAGLKALFLHFFGSNMGVTVNNKELTIQQMIVLSPPTHDASMFSE